MMEDVPASWLIGSFLEVDERRYDGAAIRALYEAEAYPPAAPESGRVAGQPPGYPPKELTMIDTLDPPQPIQYTAGFLANSFGLTLKQAREILDKANGDRDTAAELARRLRYAQP